MEKNEHLAQVRTRPFAGYTPVDSIGGKTYFTILARWPGEMRLFSVEWEMIETDNEAIAAVKQNENEALVFRNDSEVPRANVSEDIARLLVKNFLARGVDLEAIDFPSEAIDFPNFVLENLLPTDIALINRAAWTPTIAGVSYAARSQPWFPAE